MIVIKQEITCYMLVSLSAYVCMFADHNALVGVHNCHI